jgi:hypothetical protein
MDGVIGSHKVEAFDQYFEMLLEFLSRGSELQ